CVPAREAAQGAEPPGRAPDRLRLAAAFRQYSAVRGQPSRSGAAAAVAFVAVDRLDGGLERIAAPARSPLVALDPDELAPLPSPHPEHVQDGDRREPGDEAQPQPPRAELESEGEEDAERDRDEPERDHVEQ